MKTIASIVSIAVYVVLVCFIVKFIAFCTREE